MRLSDEAAKKLIKSAMTIRSTEIGCDDCAAKLEVLAEHILNAKDLPEAMQLVQEHLDRCPECNEEFQAFLKGLKELGL